MIRIRRKVDNLFNVLQSHTDFKVDIYFFGEAAKSLNSGLAYLNGALISLSSKTMM